MVAIAGGQQDNSVVGQFTNVYDTILTTHTTPGWSHGLRN